MLKTSLFTLSLGLLLLTPLGCQTEHTPIEEEVRQETGGEVDDSMTRIVEEPVEPEVEIGHSAAVVIDENSIGIEEILEPVPTVFTIRNSGLQDHMFAITGPDGSWQIDEILQPGDVANLEVTLQPGTHRVYDPLDESISFEVEVASPATGATGTESAPQSPPE